MMTKKTLPLFTLLVCLALFTSCEEENNYTGITGSVENLPTLTSNYEYAAWIIENGNIRLMGEFDTDSDGSSFLAFAPQPDQIRDASSVLITIENGGAAYTSPSATRVLVADFASADQAELNSSTISPDFTGITGSYILDSPTTTSGSLDNTGIWFTDENINQGLLMPVLADGWKYEGWVLFNGTPISTGKFSDPGAADEAAPYSANEMPYPFPGEDFNKNAPSGLTFPSNLAGKTTKITLEPEPDFSTLPYNISLLDAIIPNPAVTKTTQMMNVTTENLPKGTITKEKL